MNFLDNITEFIFVKDEPEPVDIIFITGGAYPEVGETAARLYMNGYSRRILPSGKFGILQGRFPGAAVRKEIYDGEYYTEWEFIKDVLIKNGVPRSVILKEDQAAYTYENAIYSRKVTDQAGIEVKTAIICSQAYHARRSLMYYQIQYPDTLFYVCPTNTQGITADNWFLEEEKIDKVLGEVERCGKQFTKIIKDKARGQF